MRKSGREGDAGEGPLDPPKKGMFGSYVLAIDQPPAAAPAEDDGAGCSDAGSQTDSIQCTILFSYSSSTVQMVSGSR